MLKHLRLQNIILVEQADIPFNAGLNILTGETGAGKSAIMKGLSLALGERSDTGMIRRGCEKGIVEAIFDVELDSSLFQLLEEAGIDHDTQQELIIRREISLSGKSRVFINNQLAQLALLRKIGTQLAQIVGQHANQQLFSLDYHRETLDTYGDLQSLLLEYKGSFEQENTIRHELDLLIRQESQRVREIDICQRELDELEEAQLKEGEDEELFAEYTLLVNSRELVEKVQEINQGLSGERQAILSALNRHKLALDSVVKLDPSLTDTAQAFQNALIELQEISHTLRRYQSSLQEDPGRLDEINDRLTLINKLKRKYGSTLEEVQTYRESTKKKLQRLENADAQIELLQDQLKLAEEKTNRLASQLTEKRQSSGSQLELALTLQLHSLNMSNSRFIIEITSQKRTSFGDDRIEFFIQPNKGEHQIALRETASGGEVSRVLLALQTLLAGKEKIPSLIFDEVDANIGGETAAIVGEKLRSIGQQHQVICVTHFPQVACRAHHHLQISKQEKEGRTLTQVFSLNTETQQKELERMVGGNFSSSSR